MFLIHKSFIIDEDNSVIDDSDIDSHYKPEEELSDESDGSDASDVSNGKPSIRDALILSQLSKIWDGMNTCDHDKKKSGNDPSFF